MHDRQAWLDFCGARMLVASNNSEAIECFTRLFPAFLTKNDGGPVEMTFNLIETGKADTTTDLPLTWAGLMPEGYNARIHESENETILIIEERVAIRFDHTEGLVEATYPPGRLDEVINCAGFMIVAAAVERNGQTLIHAATLIERLSGMAILLCVPSGGGKTTTSLALAHEGYDLVTDDASVLSCLTERTKPQIWGLPRALKVHRKTAELLCWLGPMQDRWDINDEQALPPEILSDRIGHITSPVPTDLAAIIVLGPRSAGGHKLEPLSKPQALIALAGDNVAWRPAGMTARAGNRFDQLSDMVAATPTFLLSAGEDLASLPALVSNVLKKALGRELTA